MSSQNVEAKREALAAVKAKTPHDAAAIHNAQVAYDKALVEEKASRS